MPPSATLDETRSTGADTNDVVLEVERLSLTHAHRREPSLHDVSLHIRSGERVLLLGPSGCGKTSLALSLNGIIPRSIPARLSGRIELAGTAVSERSPGEWADTIAYVFQDPEAQLCTLTVEDEIAFALENQALAPSEIERRIDIALAQVGIPRSWRQRATRTMSGGEKQKLVLAAALAQAASLYIFDETTSHLDPATTIAAYRLIDRIIAGGQGRSALFIDHRLDQLAARIDRVFVMDGSGRVVASGPPARLFYEDRQSVAATGSWQPLASRLTAFLGDNGIALGQRPLTMAEIPDILASWAKRATGCDRHRLHGLVRQWLSQRRPSAVAQPSGEPALQAEKIAYAPRGGPTLLRDVSLTLWSGEILGLVGANGAGKSTLGLVLAGLLRPSSGRLWRRPENEAGAFLFQNPERQFVSTTVAAEIGDTLAGGPECLASLDDRLQAALGQLGLSSKRESHPFQLSQGEKRRLSMFSVAHGPMRPVLVLDEPSFGLDAEGTTDLIREIADLRQSGRGIVLITHDMDLAARLCDRLAVMARGRILRIDRPEAIFADRALLAEAHLRPPTDQPVAEWLDAQPC